MTRSNKSDEEELRLKINSVHENILPETPSFQAIVKDPFGFDGLPCALLCQLNWLYFPSSVVAVTNLTTGDKGVLNSFESMMMIVAASENILEFRCNTSPEIFQQLKRCLCSLFRHNDNQNYGGDYGECSQILKMCGHDPVKLIRSLEEAVEMNTGIPILVETDASPVFKKPPPLWTRLDA